MGGLWYLLTLLPVIGLVQVGSQAMADRYMYLPLIGLAVAVSWGAQELLARRRRLLLAAALATIAALSWTTHRQLRHWRSSEALFVHTLHVTRDNPIAHAHLGAALLERGATAEAIQHYSEAIRLRPKWAKAYLSRATIYGILGRDEEAVADCTEAIRLDKTKPRYFQSRGPARCRLGDVVGARTDMEAAGGPQQRAACCHSVRGGCWSPAGTVRSRCCRSRW